jgi:hypothetical protein
LATTTTPTFRFDGRNPAAQRVAARQAGRFITRILEETRAAIRSLITRSIREGIAPRDAARAIRSMVGMNEQQAQAAANYRQSLIDLGVPLDKVEARVATYTAKKIRERALTIARTETMGALNEGARESWREAQDEGLLSDRAVVEWLTTPDELLCPICEPMDGVQVKLGEKFETSVGPLDGPPAHPNCRCSSAATEPDR